MFIEYPKALYKGDDCTTVADAAGEAVARADGYEMYADIHARVTGQEKSKEKEVVEPSTKRKPKGK